MPSKHGIAVFGARALAGILGIGIAVVAVDAAAFLPWPTIAQTQASAVVSPAPSEQERVCPGPLLALGADSGNAQAATSVGPSAAVSGAMSVPAPGSGVVPSLLTNLAAGDNAQSGRDGAPRLLRVPAQVGVSAAPLVAGSQSQTAASETLAGLAVAACTEAVGDSWLVGGSTDVGRTSLVLLSNPTTVVATVDLSVFGEVGEVDAPGSTGILVQPGAQRIVSLAGLAPNLKSPVVHVQSHGGQVAAALEQSVIRGIAPGGAEMIGPSSGPALAQVIAGILVTSAPAVAASDTDSVSDGTPSVRILVPGDKPAKVQVHATGESGQAAGTSLQVEAQPGIATEVPLPGLAAGSYSVRLASDRPIVAAARASTTAPEGRDFAWFGASDALTGPFMVGVAAGPAPALHLVNTGAKTARLTIGPEHGAPTEVSVPAGGQTVVPVVAGARYSVSGGTSIVASVGYAGAGLLSSFSLNPPGPLAAPIRVYSR